MDVQSIIRALLFICLLLMALLASSSCSMTKEVVAYSKPVIVSNTHSLNKKIILPNPPVCAGNQSYLEVKWYSLVSENGNVVPDLYVVKSVDMHSLSYNIQELKACVKQYRSYVDTVEEIVDKYNNSTESSKESSKENNNESSDIQ